MRGAAACASAECGGAALGAAGPTRKSTRGGKGKGLRRQGTRASASRAPAVAPHDGATGRGSAVGVREQERKQGDAAPGERAVEVRGWESGVWEWGEGIGAWGAAGLVVVGAGVWAKRRAEIGGEEAERAAMVARERAEAAEARAGVAEAEAAGREAAVAKKAAALARIRAGLEAVEAEERARALAEQRTRTEAERRESVEAAAREARAARAAAERDAEAARRDAKAAREAREVERAKAEARLRQMESEMLEEAVREEEVDQARVEQEVRASREAEVDAQKAKLARVAEERARMEAEAEAARDAEARARVREAAEAAAARAAAARAAAERGRREMQEGEEERAVRLWRGLEEERQLRVAAIRAREEEMRAAEEARARAKAEAAALERREARRRERQAEREARARATLARAQAWEASRAEREAMAAEKRALVEELKEQYRRQRIEDLAGENEGANQSDEGLAGTDVDAPLGDVQGFVADEALSEKFFEARASREAERAAVEAKRRAEGEGEERRVKAIRDAIAQDTMARIERVKIREAELRKAREAQEARDRAAEASARAAARAQQREVEREAERQRKADRDAAWEASRAEREALAAEKQALVEQLKEQYRRQRDVAAAEEAAAEAAALEARQLLDAEDEEERRKMDGRDVDSDAAKAVECEAASLQNGDGCNGADDELARRAATAAAAQAARAARIEESRRAEQAAEERRRSAAEQRIRYEKELMAEAIREREELLAEEQGREERAAREESLRDNLDKDDAKRAEAKREREARWEAQRAEREALAAEKARVVEELKEQYRVRRERDANATASAAMSTEFVEDMRENEKVVAGADEAEGEDLNAAIYNERVDGEADSDVDISANQSTYEFKDLSVEIQRVREERDAKARAIEAARRLEGAGESARVAALREASQRERVEQMRTVKKREAELRRAEEEAKRERERAEEDERKRERRLRVAEERAERARLKAERDAKWEATRAEREALAAEKARVVEELKEQYRLEREAERMENEAREKAAARARAIAAEEAARRRQEEDAERERLAKEAEAERQRQEALEATRRSLQAVGRFMLGAVAVAALGWGVWSTTDGLERLRPGYLSEEDVEARLERAGAVYDRYVDVIEAYRLAHPELGSELLSPEGPRLMAGRDPTQGAAALGAVVALALGLGVVNMGSRESGVGADVVDASESRPPGAGDEGKAVSGSISAYSEDAEIDGGEEPLDPELLASVGRLERSISLAIGEASARDEVSDSLDSSKIAANIEVVGELEKVEGERKMGDDAERMAETTRQAAEELTPMADPEVSPEMVAMINQLKAEEEELRAKLRAAKQAEAEIRVEEAKARLAAERLRKASRKAKRKAARELREKEAAAAAAERLKREQKEAMAKLSAKREAEERVAEAARQAAEVARAKAEAQAAEIAEVQAAQARERAAEMERQRKEYERKEAEMRRAEEEAIVARARAAEEASRAEQARAEAQAAERVRASAKSAERGRAEAFAAEQARTEDTQNNAEFTLTRSIDEETDYLEGPRSAGTMDASSADVDVAQEEGVRRVSAARSGRIVRERRRQGRVSLRDALLQGVGGALLGKLGAGERRVKTARVYSRLLNRYVDEADLDALEAEAEVRGAKGTAEPAVAGGTSQNDSRQDVLDEMAVRRAEAGALLMVGAAACLANPEYIASGGTGDDACFAGASAIGVADGVGGWEEAGEAAAFAKALMEGAERASAAGAVDPLKMLDAGYAGVRRLGAQGACTACVVGLQPDGSLRAANLGDSGFIVLRRSNLVELVEDAADTSAHASAEAMGFVVVSRSEPQQHFFNCPFQLMWDGADEGDAPADAQAYDVRVEPGDVLVVATDGLFDNLFDGDICRIAGEVLGNPPPTALEASVSSVALADRLARAAQALATAPGYRSPFAAAWEAEADPDQGAWEGGKLDDTTVVVAQFVAPTPGQSDSQGDDDNQEHLALSSTASSSS